MSRTPLSSRPAPTRWTAALKALPALAIRQPYAWLVAHGFKDIENRSRRTHYRGQFLIHASLNVSFLNDETLNSLPLPQGIKLPNDFHTGGIIGVAEIVCCERDSTSPWKDPSSWGWVLANARPLPFRSCKGALGFFRPKID